jgi:hypothetical protein
MDSWLEGYRFLDTLIIREQDTFCAQNPTRALGGVRGTRASTMVRIDFVSHTAQALIKGLRFLERNKSSKEYTDERKRKYQDPGAVR